MAVILARLEKVELVQKEDYNLLERKVSELEKAAEKIHEELSEDAKVHRILYEGTSMAKDADIFPAEKPLGVSAAKNAATPRKVMRANNVVCIVLLCAGIICLGLSAFYLFQLIFQERWHDANVRIPQLIQFFGGVTFIILSKVIRNQEAIIRGVSAKKEEDSKNA
jgi:hypothetical protein